MTRISTYAALLPLALAACTIDKDLLTEGTPGDTGQPSSSSGSETSGETTAEPAPTTTTGPTDDPSFVTEVTTAPDSETGLGETSTTEPDSPGVTLLETCEIDEPCPKTTIDPLFPNRAPGMDCMYPLLRDGVAFRMRWQGGGGGEGVWVALGDPERTVLTTIQEGSMETPVSRCTLAPPEFFTNCVDAPGQDICLLTGAWIEECVPELAPMCPAP